MINETSRALCSNFGVAVDYCLEAGLMAEALLLAQCGEPSLWNRYSSALRMNGPEVVYS